MRQNKQQPPVCQVGVAHIPLRSENCRTGGGAVALGLKGWSLVMRLWLIKRIRRPDSDAAEASIEPIMMTESNVCECM